MFKVTTAVVGVLHQQRCRHQSGVSTHKLATNDNRRLMQIAFLAFMYSKEHAEFLTVTCLNWHPLLEKERDKEIIIGSLRYLVRSERIFVYAFVLMKNHFHLIWQMRGKHKREDVQRDFLKFTGQQILKELRNESSPMLKELLVFAKDRKHQVWERNSLGIPLWSPKVMDQKMEYIHNNPVKAGLCEFPENYKYSSARFYLMNEFDWDFVSHVDG